MVVYVYPIINATASMVTLGMAVVSLVSRQNALQSDDSIFSIFTIANAPTTAPTTAPTDGPIYSGDYYYYSGDYYYYSGDYYYDDSKRKKRGRPYVNTALTKYMYTDQFVLNQTMSSHNNLLDFTNF